MSAIVTYLRDIQEDYRGGRATEHTYRSALKNLIEEIGDKITATNEPKNIECGRPDFVIIKDVNLVIGYIETKQIGENLDEWERSNQIKRYLVHPNFILTDYLEFRWYVDGKRRAVARVAEVGKDRKIPGDKSGGEAALKLLEGFIGNAPEPIGNPHELAVNMARLTHCVRDIIIESFSSGKESETLKELRNAFATNLIPDLAETSKIPEFADMYAQTLAYGLFAAWVNHKGLKPFDRQGAAADIHRTNPFLSSLFHELTGPRFDRELYAGYVDDIVRLLAHAEKGAVLEHFGKRGLWEDPVVHFYETFLAAYDPKLRESRGVYYTPEPVVSYIVRSIDCILKERFNCQGGLEEKAKLSSGSHRVLILDPACGTGTFLYAVVDLIRRRFIQRGETGAWSGYVKNHLLPRLFGFELLMAPYAVAHFKLAMQLAAQDLDEDQRRQWAYDFQCDERIGIYLTNTLEEAVGKTEQIGLFERFIAEEANAAARIKSELPILVVMGNPPYSNFGMMNKGKWILDLLKEYKKDLNEKKINIDDDFIKFIRWGQWRIIERTGAGILAFIANNTYIDGLIHRRMRQSLMESFTDIYILDLHGSSKKKENCPDGSKDENVFDIQQGVAIGIFIKEPSKKKQPARVHHAELWGLRKSKYSFLESKDIRNTKWRELNPREEHFFFVPKGFKLKKEYVKEWSLRDIFLQNQNGLKTDRDDLFIDFNDKDIIKRIETFYSDAAIEYPFREKYRVEDSSSYDLMVKRKQTSFNKKNVHQCLYRPFDTRWIYYAPGLTSRPAWQVMRHMIAKKNISLLSCRQQAKKGFKHIFCSKTITECCAVSLESREITSLFPLYLYPDPDKNGNLFPNGSERHVNLKPEFISDFEKRLKLRFIYDGKGNLKKTFGPEDVFNYIYAILHSPTYRKRYIEFLKIDFPRVPLTSDIKLFRYLCPLGAELVALHLLEAPILNNRDKLMTRFHERGDNFVDKAHPKYDEKNERVYISRDDATAGKKGQYFERVPPEVWNFHIGGYQVCHKWLKDRQGRNLSDNEITAYPKIVMALSETIRIMKEIDVAIPKWPLS